MTRIFVASTLGAFVAAATLTQAQQPAGAPVASDIGEIRPVDPARFYKAPGYSPYAGKHYPARPLFGDQHLHTGWSVDAGGSGTTIGPEDALRFARGEEVKANTGQPVKLARPFDWVAITDHSDGMGTIFAIREGNPEMMKDPTLKRWHDMMLSGPEGAAKATFELIVAQTQKKLPAAITDPKWARSYWEQNTALMEKYNEPGRFTAFIAYEWTSNAGGGDNLHRNVIYRDGKKLADQVLPMTTFVSENPEDLWKWMEAWEKKTGGKLLAIPHNGNLSNGRMFELQMFMGSAMTRDWAQQRQNWEPLYEIFQFKGQSEAHPLMSPSDEFTAGYELWDRGNLIMLPKKPGMLEHEYLRQALKDGLKVEQDLGSNPFKYGAAGGTDTHSGLSAAEEDNFFGKFLSAEPRADRWSEDALKFGDRVVKGWELMAAGRTAVWALENTRESIWDAMKRRETYATSGPLITVRFYAGYDFVDFDARSRAPAIVGYAKGVPMGANLKKAPAGKAPTFLVAAARDPLSGNLDRIQVVKGWLDRSGKLQEKIYDVVWSDTHARKLRADGKLPPVGNTVDLQTATWTNTIGDPELIAVWKDPEFDPNLKAFYYARVIEIPTPRWTAYDAAYFKVKVADNVPMITQERAVTSPIWYSP